MLTFTALATAIGAFAADRTIYAGDWGGNLSPHRLIQEAKDWWSLENDKWNTGITTSIHNSFRSTLDSDGNIVLPAEADGVFGNQNTSQDRIASTEVKQSNIQFINSKWLQGNLLTAATWLGSFGLAKAIPAVAPLAVLVTAGTQFASKFNGYTQAKFIAKLREDLQGGILDQNNHQNSGLIDYLAENIQQDGTLGTELIYEKTEDLLAQMDRDGVSISDFTWKTRLSTFTQQFELFLGDQPIIGDIATNLLKSINGAANAVA